MMATLIVAFCGRPGSACAGTDTLTSRLFEKLPGARVRLTGGRPVMGLNVACMLNGTRDRGIVYASRPGEKMVDPVVEL